MVVDRGQVVKDIKHILARFIYFFGVADPREVPLDVKNRIAIVLAARRTPLEVQLLTGAFDVEVIQ